MRVNKIVGGTALYNSLYKRPYYKEEDTKKKEEEEERQYKELKEKMEDFQSHLEKFQQEIKSNPCEKEVDLEEIQRLFRRNE